MRLKFITLLIFITSASCIGPEKYLPNIKGEINNIYLDNSKIINLIPNLNFTSIDEGLLKTVNS